MIKANELRLGSWTLYSNTQKEPFLISEPRHIELAYNLFPIPLTPEILKSCGFKKYNNAWVPLDYNEKDYNKWRFTIWSEFDDHYKYNSAEYDIELTSIHQIQNLYFALTNQELEINFKELTPH